MPRTPGSPWLAPVHSAPFRFAVAVFSGLVLGSWTRAADPLFEKDVWPIVQAKCVKCHGAEKQKAGLDMRSRAALLRGGEGGPAITPGALKNSLLWDKIATGKMPPGKEEKLSALEKETIRAWIEHGAKGVATAVVGGADGTKEVTEADRQFWAFQRPTRAAVPPVSVSDGARNAIDAFLLAELKKKGLTLAPEADRRVLIRRAAYDLTGLPPTPADVDAYLADRSPDAYEKVLDRLLASPAYGEHWGRHWLDLAGYADSEGILDADYVRTAAWRYRDYVIRAFNQDKPYDRFLREQIAGDELVDYWTAHRTQKELAPEVVEALVATGFLRCASDTSRPDFASIKNAPGYYYQTLDDTLKIVASSTLGLTLECARCHSHKYDPIPQTEYYRLQAVFMSAYRPGQWVPQVQRRLNEATEAEEQAAKKHNAEVDAAIADRRKQIAALQQPLGDVVFAERLAKLPEAIRADVQAALAADPAKRNEVQKYLVSKFQKELRPDPAALAKILAERFPDYRSKVQPLEQAIQAQEARRRTFPEIRALYDLPGEVKTPLLRRGDYLNPGREVTPGVLTALAVSQPYAWKPPAKDARSSGRRLAFADWLTQPDHPLTARVLVNRLWANHFGEGLVSTPDNFGHTGARPSHPELLDWLAVEFVARGQSIKAMHRIVMTSSAYRQSSASAATTASGKTVDPDNRLLWRQRIRRIQAESLRDSLLFVSGTLNAERFGPPVPIRRLGSGEVVTLDDAPGRRRSVYLQVRRSQPLTILQVFDQPVMETNCTRRGVSTVASQALTLLNSDFLVQRADAMAERVLRDDPSHVIECAVRLAFCRPATDREQARMTQFLDAQAARYRTAPAGGTQTPDDTQRAARKALADLCHMLLSANEFAYVD